MHEKEISVLPVAIVAICNRAQCDQEYSFISFHFILFYVLFFKSLIASPSARSKGNGCNLSMHVTSVNSLSPRWSERYIQNAVTLLE